MTRDVTAMLPPTSPGVRLDARRVIRLPAEPSSVPQIRQLVVQALTDWQLDAFAHDVCVCVSELAGNACRHADSTKTVRVSLHLAGRCLTVHVRDSDPSPPMPRPQLALDAEGVPDWAGVDILPEGGFGLPMVDTLSSGWSWSSSPDGKVVSCQFDFGTST